jgi:hypothetical protein
MRLYPFIAIIILGAGFAIAHLLSSRAFALLGNWIDPYAGLKWVLAIISLIIIALLLWRFLFGMIFGALAYCSLSAAAAVRMHALPIPPSPRRYLIGSMISKALGMVISIAIWVATFWNVMLTDRLHF